MRKRPLSVTIIAWYLIVTNVLFGVFVTVTLSNREMRAAVVENPVLAFTYAEFYCGIIICLLSAIFMLRAANWARWLYIVLSAIGLLSTLVDSPPLSMIPVVAIYGIIVVFLLRPKAAEYFTHSRSLSTPS